jgi:hypothetical protein
MSESVAVQMDDDDDGGVEITIVDDVPEADRARFVAPDSTDSDDDITVAPSEISQYKTDVQKRIKDLSFKANSERRAKETAVREREAAVNYAAGLIAENNRLKHYSAHNETALVTTAKIRSEEQIAGLKRDAKEAFESGDTDRFLEMQEQMQRRVAEHTRYAEYVPQPVVETPMPEVRQQTAAEVVPDKIAVEWYDKNKWFQAEGDEEAEMTAYAFGISDILINKKNLDPRSSEYYAEIDAAVRRTFPRYAGFKTSASASDVTRRPVSVVAAATRSPRTARKVHLTASQQSIARRLGLTLEQYAAQL